MIVEKLHKRQKVRVLAPDIPARKVFVMNDAKASAGLVTWSLLKDVELEPDDQLTVDVRILIERSKDDETNLVCNP